MRKNIIPCLLMMVALCSAHAQTKSDSLSEIRRSRRVLIPQRSLELYDVKTPNIEISDLFMIPEHPAFQESIDQHKKSEMLQLINLRRLNINKDTLLTSDLFYIYKPYFEYLRNIDPHLRFQQIPALKKETYPTQRDVDKAPGNRRLPFTLLVINDSVVINQSADVNFKKGDLLISINEVPMSEYLKYSYKDRYTNPLALMLNYYYSFATYNFNIRLLRDGQPMIIKTAGVTFKYYFDALVKPEQYNVTTYDSAKTGYVQIKNFYPYNTRLIKIVHSAIKRFKKKGYNNVIVDIRRNSGGSGHSFDKLLSIFINKSRVPYMKSQRLKVSQQTLEDYDHLNSNMIGQTVEVPEKYIVKEFNTDPKMYVDGMNYYVLVSENTGSVAATFANILQYNGAAKLVGEPLLKNALKYGEVISGYDFLPYLIFVPSISTMEFDEYTNAIEGVVAPDISIPYVAVDYMTGKDAMLEKLLDIINYCCPVKIK